jgi:RimJ/RimL family protein N-acetyltransferase
VIDIRPATDDDAARLLAWRNDPRTREASLDTAEVAWDDHVAWYARALADPGRIIVIAELDGEAIGMVRFDRAADLAEVSINLAPEARGRRLAEPVLRAAIERYLEGPDVPAALDAVIRDDNAASIRTFLALGFRARGSSDGVGRYRRQSSSDQDTGVPVSAS